MSDAPNPFASLDKHATDLQQAERELKARIASLIQDEGDLALVAVELAPTKENRAAHQKAVEATAKARSELAAVVGAQAALRRQRQALEDRIAAEALAAKKAAAHAAWQEQRDALAAFDEWLTGADAVVSKVVAANEALLARLQAVEEYRRALPAFVLDDVVAPGYRRLGEAGNGDLFRLWRIELPVWVPNAQTSCAAALADLGRYGEQPAPEWTSGIPDGPRTAPLPDEDLLEAAE